MKKNHPFRNWTGKTSRWDALDLGDENDDGYGYGYGYGYACISEPCRLTG
jgi:hypothetical protein